MISKSTSTTSGAPAPPVPDDHKDQPKDEKPTSKPQTFWNGETLAFWENLFSLTPSGSDEEREARIEAAVQERDEQQKATVAMFRQENPPKKTRRGRGAKHEEQGENEDMSRAV